MSFLYYISYILIMYTKIFSLHTWLSFYILHTIYTLEDLKRRFHRVKKTKV